MYPQKHHLRWFLRMILTFEKCRTGFEYILVMINSFSEVAQADPTWNKSGKPAPEKEVAREY